MARFTLNGKRYDTGKMVTLWTGKDEVGTGVTRRGIYMTPKSKRVFVETHSIWDRGDGCTVGTRYHEADAEEIGFLADEYRLDELFALLPDDNE
jgi:hypothetical protein